MAWGLETTPEVLIRTVVEGGFPDAADLLGRIASNSARARERRRKRVTGRHRGVAARDRRSELVVLEGCGHAPTGRDPVRTNLLLHEFLGPAQSPVRASGGSQHPQAKAGDLRLQSDRPGHARRDLALAEALRRVVPDLRIDWLTQEPVSSLLLARGETLHPRSRDLVSEVTHIEMEMETQSIAHDLHAFQAFRRMGEILVANFLTFLDAVRDVPYDLWIADEGWDVDYFLHENPELKSAPYVWLTDFVGMLPMLPNEEFRHRQQRRDDRADRAVSAGATSRCSWAIRPTRARPLRSAATRDQAWTAHYRFPGYLQYFDPAAYRSPRAAGASALSRGVVVWSAAPLQVITVGADRSCGAEVRKLVRIANHCGRDRTSTRMLPSGRVEAWLRADLFEHLAAYDLALVQGGLSTTMELVATGRPFLYFPLRNHFEQMRHVPHRLANYGVGTPARVDFDDLTPDFLAERIARALGQAPEYRPVEMGGPERAAQMIAGLL